MNEHPRSMAVARYETPREQLEARAGQFATALPSTIAPERFLRIVMTAIAGNPELLEVSRGSLMLARMKAAQDGLLPDGREAALVVFRDRSKGKVASYQRMVAGIRRLVLQSGEIATFAQHCVYKNSLMPLDRLWLALVKRPYLMPSVVKLLSLRIPKAFSRDPLRRAAHPSNGGS